MTSSIDQTGLTIDQKSQIIQDLIDDYKAIYGADINVDSNSPDGQLINIQAQVISDYLELLQDTYNSFAISTAFGERLDELVALNGIQRKKGTLTQAEVLVTVSKALTLPGLDQSALTPFTVSDNAGNEFQLVVSKVFGAPGNSTLTFQASEIGEIQTTANTITNVVTSTLGVTSVNNPSVASDVIGVNEETDPQLKVRHDKSLNLGATGPSDSMEAALKNVVSVVDAIVIENNTGGVVNTIPAHSVWPIVRGGAAVDVAQAIYSKKGPGGGLKGAETQIVTRPNGQTFTAQWDIAISQNLFIKFSIIWKGAPALADADIISALAVALNYKLGEDPNIGDLVREVATIAPTAIVTIISSSQGVSKDDVVWASVVQPDTSQFYFQVLEANITIT